MRGNPNDLTSAICDMWDIKRSVPKDIQKLPKDNEGTEYTIGECIDDVLNYLQSLEKKEQGTVYTGDAPSTEASFYKKSEVEDLDNQSYSEGERYDNE